MVEIDYKQPSFAGFVPYPICVKLHTLNCCAIRPKLTVMPHIMLCIVSSMRGSSIVPSVSSASFFFKIFYSFSLLARLHSPTGYYLEEFRTA